MYNKPMNNIEGTWLSRYEYTEGSSSEPSVSEHRIAFKPDGNKWIGDSISQTDGSEVTLELTQKGITLSGAWHERTAPTGHYEGREFNGLLMVTLNDEGTELNGMWLGVSSSTGRVKSGAWTLQKVSD
jgi:hypothetical protein